MALALTIRVLLNTAGVGAQANQLQSQAEGIGKGFKAAAGAAAAFAGVAAVMKVSVDAASRLQQSMGGVEAVFKDSADQVKAWGKNAAQTVGLAQSEYQDLATLIGSQLKNAGVSMDELGPKTNDLITQGADLAAMYGGTTKEAVEALSSALKGESGPMERYGTSITAAAVASEAAALGLDMSTDAAKRASTAQATLSLIAKQTADAQGAAGRESESYASVMQKLGAIVENAMAQVGTVLLPIISNLGDAFAEVVPIIADFVSNGLEAIISIGGDIIGFFQDVPGPVYAAVGAFTGMLIIGSLIGPVQAIIAIVRALTAQFFLAGGAATFFSGILRTIGGPWIIALGAVAAAIAWIATSSSDAAIEVQDLSDAVDANTGALKANAIEIIAGKIQATEDAYVALGGAVGDVTAAVAQVPGAGAKVDKTFRDMALAAAANTANFDVMNQVQGQALRTNEEIIDEALKTPGALAAIGGAVGEVGRAYDAYQLNVGSVTHAQELGRTAAAAAAAATEAQTQATTDAAAVTAEQAKAARDLAIANAEAGTAAAQAAVDQNAVNVALAGTSDAADRASTAINFFVIKMNEVAGNTPSLEQAAQNLNDTLRSTAAAFKGTAEDGGYSREALNDWNIAALTSTERGSQIYSSLINAQSAFATSTVAAFQNAEATTGAGTGMAAAAAAADVAYQAFMTMADGAGLTTTEAQELAAQLGIVQGTALDPKTFELIVQKEQADKDLAAAQALEIEAKNIDVTATVAPAVDDINTAATDVPEATIPVAADTPPAVADIEDAAGADYPAEITVEAPVNEASADIKTVAGANYLATINVGANTTAAQGAITAITAAYREATITVVANTNPAIQTINSLINTNWQASIDVSANTSAARAAIASVPTVVNVGPTGYSEWPTLWMSAGGPPAFFEPAEYMPLHSSSGGGTSDNPTVVNNFTINGALDPTAVARQIQGILTAQERRLGGVSR